MAKQAVENPFARPRRRTRQIRIGAVRIGSGAPVCVEGMTKTDTADVEATVRQIVSLQEAGCELVRVAVPTKREAQAIREIRPQVSIPLMADVHFSSSIAREAIKAGADSIRLNPGTVRNRTPLKEICALALEKGVPIRVGVNSGSMRTKVKNPKELPLAMATEALEFCEFLEGHGVRDIIVSVKASEPLATMEAYREVAGRCDYPLHLGVTAAGTQMPAAVKSGLVIGGLLAEGIGDTIRVSMTAPPEKEIAVAWLILESVGLRRRGPEVISCPTCGRCQINLVELVARVESDLAEIETPLRVAVMGCVVNGPGEASEADVGVAGGKGFGFIFSHGEKLRKVPEDRLAEELLKEVRSFIAARKEE